MKLRPLLLAVALLLAAYPLSEGPAWAFFCTHHRLSETPSWSWFYRPLERLGSDSLWFGRALMQYKSLWHHPRTFSPVIDLNPQHLDDSPLTFHITSRRLTTGDIEVTANIIGKLEPAPDNYDLIVGILRQP